MHIKLIYCSAAAAAGLVYRGSSARLRRVISKLLHGEKIHVSALGSSITYGRRIERGTSDWFTLFSSWLQGSFPAAQVTVRNRALPLARSEYVSACLDQHVDPQADLVFVEVGDTRHV
jgi:lysophospholipase L1-like esterase